MEHSHKSLSNASDSKLMTLFPYNQNTALTWKKIWDNGSKRVKHTILPEPLHTICVECERSCRQTPHMPTDATEQHWWDLVWWQNRSTWYLDMSRFSLSSLIKSKKVRKHIMNYTHIYNYHWSRIFILFNINSAILRKLGKYVVSFFNCLQLKAKCSFFTVRVFIDKNIFGTYKLVFI